MGKKVMNIDPKLIHLLWTTPHSVATTPYSVASAIILVQPHPILLQPHPPILSQLHPILLQIQHGCTICPCNIAPKSIHHTDASLCISTLKILLLKYNKCFG